MEGKTMSKNFQYKNFTDNYFEYEKTGKDISVVGRLKRNVKYWESFGCSKHILNLIQNGYILPLIKEVLPIELKNNKSSLEETNFVQESIDELLRSKAIVECKTATKVVNPLTVARKGTKLRLVLDLRHVNQCLELQTCKFEGHETALQFFEKGEWLTSFDLKAGYHHIDIVKEHQELLGFSFLDHTGQKRYFKFSVLPFGLKTAGLVFTKVLRELVKVWRFAQIQAVVFLDDGLQTNANFTLACQHSLIIKGALISSGFVPNRDKS